MLRGLLYERQRADAITALGIGATDPEPALDRLAEDAACAFKAPIALVSFMSGDTQWVKASHGIDTGCLPRSDSLCNFVVDRSDLLECCAPERDPRFAALSCVRGSPYIRYYIGVPLRLLNGRDIGALCVADIVARAPASADQKAYLLGLARHATRVVETQYDIRRGGAAA